MLDNNDRQQIIAIIQQTIASSLGSSKQSNKFQGTTYSKYGKASQKDWERQQREREKKDRIAELEDKRRKGKDSLAQRLELAKLRSEEKLFGNISPEVKDLLKGTAKTVSKVAGGVATGVTAGALGTASAVRNSKLGSSLLSSMMMSNPLTAILYMNSDLINGTARGVGKIAKTLGKGALGTAGVLGKGLFGGASWMYSKLRKSTADATDDDNTTTGTSLIPGQPKRTIRTGKTNVMASTNYIMAKNAMLIGGKNYFYISLGGGFGGGLTGAMSGVTHGAGAIAGATAGALSGTFTPLLPGPTDGTQPSFAGGGRRMRNVTPKDDTSKSIVKGITGMHEQAKKSNELQKEANKKIATIAGISLLAVAGIVALALALKNKSNIKLPPPKGPSAGDKAQQVYKKFDDLTKQPNKVYEEIKASEIGKIKNYKIAKTKTGRQVQFKFENEGQLVPSPFDGIIKQVIPSGTRISSSIDREFNITILVGKHKAIKIIHHVMDADYFVFPSKEVQKGDIIGRTGKGKIITIESRGISDKEAKALGEGYKATTARSKKDELALKNRAIYNLKSQSDDFIKQFSDEQQNLRQQAVTQTPLVNKVLKSTTKGLGNIIPVLRPYTDQLGGELTPEITKAYTNATIPKASIAPINLESSNVTKAKNNIRSRKGKPTGYASGISNISDEVLQETKPTTVNISTPDTIFYSLPIEDTMKANAGLLGIQQ